MDRPKWGTCGECRWRRGDSRNVWCIRHAPPWPSIGAEVVGETACGEWEPPDGRCCGTCEHWAIGEALDVKIAKWAECVITGDPPPMGKQDRKHRADTCPAWQWRGSE